MNRIAGNIIIIDSAMGNQLALTSANLSIQISKLMVNAIAVYQADTTGSILLTGANTSLDVIFRSDWVSLTSDSMGKVYANNPSWFSFGQAQPFESIKAPVVTAGTVMLYFV